MIILGDIGNTETKICLVNNNKIIKRIIVPSKGKKINKKKFEKDLKISFEKFLSKYYKTN